MAIRNQYSTSAGDALYGGTFTLQQLRNNYSENGGILTPRRRQFLRRFIPPFVDSKPITLSTRFAIILPKNKVLEVAPPAVVQALRPFFEPVGDIEWWLANPWLGDRDFAINPTAIDNELGGAELSGVRKLFWDEEDVPEEQITP